jgi:hypothetical protein
VPNALTETKTLPPYPTSGSRRAVIARGFFSVAPAAIQHLVDDQFSVQHGVSTGKPNAHPDSGNIEKHDPFPAIGIPRFDDFKLDVFHDHPPFNGNEIPLFMQTGVGSTP